MTFELLHRVIPKQWDRELAEQLLSERLIGKANCSLGACIGAWKGNGTSQSTAYTCALREILHIVVVKRFHVKIIIPLSESWQ